MNPGHALGVIVLLVAFVPVGHPIAAVPPTPVVLQVLLGCAVVFVIGFAAPCWRIHARSTLARA